MAWQDQMTIILRSLINDLDDSPYTYADARLQTILLVSARLMLINVDFANSYTVDVTNATLTPDPTDPATQDDAFVVLTSLRAACIILGNEIKAESGNAISIKDGPSAIDLRGVTGTLTTLYKDLSSRYEELLLEYRAGNSVAGQAILGPYSSTGFNNMRNNLDGRDGLAFFNSY